jgi:hypothetical protein
MSEDSGWAEQVEREMPSHGVGLRRRPHVCGARESVMVFGGEGCREALELCQPHLTWSDLLYVRDGTGAVVATIKDCECFRCEGSPTYAVVSDVHPSVGPGAEIKRWTCSSLPDAARSPFTVAFPARCSSEFKAALTLAVCLIDLELERQEAAMFGALLGGAAGSVA